MTIYRKIKIYDKEKAQKNGFLNYFTMLYKSGQLEEKMESFSTTVYNLLNGNIISSLELDKNYKIEK